MDSDLLAASDRNFCHANGLFMGTSLRGEVLENALLQIVSCGLPAAEHNFGFVKLPPRDAVGALAATEAYFGARALPFRMMVRSDHAPACADAFAARGLVEKRRTPVMLLDPIRDGAAPPPELEIRRVRDAADVARFQATAFEGFGLPAQAARLFLTDELFASPELEAYIGLVDGEPAATSLLIRTADVAGIYWVATREPFRSRGLGEAITWASVRAGRAHGCAVASLQASALGAPVYARMGFHTPAHYASYERAQA